MKGDHARCGWVISNFLVISYLTFGDSGTVVLQCILMFTAQVPTPKELPASKIKSIEEGKQKYEKYLHNIGHTTSAGFDPWKFADQ